MQIMTIHTLSRKDAFKKRGWEYKDRKKVNHGNNNHNKEGVVILLSVKANCKTEYHQQERGTFHNDQAVNSTK